MTRARKLALLVAGMLCVALGAYVGFAGAATGTSFATVGTLPNGPIGVAVSPTQLIVSQYSSTDLLSISDTGVVSATPYATLPLFAPAPGPLEIYLAFSPGANGWAPGDLYATQDNLIYKVAAGGGGGSVSLFSTIPAASCDDTHVPARTIHTGITFDTVGTFGNDMIVTCVNGSVFRINTAGTATLVNATGLYLEGPAVAPAGFGPQGGKIFAGAEELDKVVAIDASGVTDVVTGFKAPEDLEVVPASPCTFGNSGGSLFEAWMDAVTNHQIGKFSAADVTSAGAGNMLVTSEGGDGTKVITFSAGSYALGAFSSESTPHEGADVCSAGPNANIKITPATADNPVNTNHVLTITVTAINGTIDAGSHTATASIVSGPGGFVGSPSCSYTGGAATTSCTVTITSAVAGQTVVSATSDIPVSGTTFTRTTNTAVNTAAGGSGNAVKNWHVPSSFCPLTQGYWKNHSSAWPASALPMTLGSQSYSQSELLALFGTAPKGDASLILAHQLIAAKLNIAAGSDPTPIQATITDADALLSGFSGKLPYNVKSSSVIGGKMTADADQLDHYNSRQLTPSCPKEN